MVPLPEEIIEEILSRLPVKSLLRFKIASKNFYSLISKDEGFAKLHLINQSSLASRNHTLFVQATNAIFQHTSVYSWESSRKIRIPDEIAKPCFIIGSANGLICVTLGSEKFCFIWNPCTEHCKRIIIPTEGCNIFGFGYNAVCDDYKIVGKWENKFQVFSLKSNSWTTKETGFPSKLPKFSVFSNGAIHWFTDEKTITAFHLATEEFFFIETPVEIIYKECFWNSPLFDDKGSLCLYERNSKPLGWSVWVMKEYNVTKSWAKLFTVLDADRKALGKVLFKEAKLYYYNDLYGFEMVRFFRYSESLIWPKYLDIEPQITQSKRPKKMTHWILGCVCFGGFIGRERE